MNDAELKKLHVTILQIAIDFDAFCKENNIAYYLMGGTALGAMRHKGFIPWDDDFDVFMDSKNYFKFINLAKTNINTEKYYFQKENTEEWPLYFSKLRMNNTTFIEKDVVDRKMHHGVYIDIMCLNNAFDNIILRYLQYFSARLLSSAAIGKKGYVTSSKLKKVALFISKFIVVGVVKKWLLQFVRSLNSKDTKYVGHFFGRAPFKKTSFYCEYLMPARTVEFENTGLPVPNMVEKYLTVRYGNNYMSLPSQKERDKFPSHAFIVDTATSYEHYINVKK